MVYGDMTKGLSIKLNKLIVAVEETLCEMENDNYRKEVREKLSEL